MGERKWTAEQLSAIETRDKTLLVSAAAGSGKTATLTERIIRSLTDEKNPVNIDSMLVVTFTNAAAAELRTKISAALTSAVAKNPENKRLSRQLHLLPMASIRTIDSFCSELVRQNADRAGVSPTFRVADAAECDLLARNILDGLIEAVYRGDCPEVATPEEFDELTDCLTDSKRADEIGEVLLYVHEKCESNEAGIDALLPLIEKYSDRAAVEDNAYGKYLMEKMQKMLSHYEGCIDRYIRAMNPDEPAEKKYIDCAYTDLALVRRLLCSESYEDMRERINSAALERKPSVTKANLTAAMEGYSAVRDGLKSDIKDALDFFHYDTDAWHALFASLERLLLVLYRFEKKFDSLFAEEKRRRSALSYSDIERYAYRVLISDGEPTDIAKNLKDRYAAVYIDEYQDVNSLQNKIFEAISRQNNRFMVGDIKQSIYGFRSAKPEIFANMKATFPPLDEAADGSCASVFMSANFRCNESIIDFVNGIFDRAFSLLSDSIGYKSEDRLKFSKICAENTPYRKPEICMVDKDSELSAPKVVARKIRELLQNGLLDSGERIRPSDIAIIMRNARGKDDLYAEALKELGIPVKIQGAKDFFLSPEILLTLCLLNTIDNPSRDIYLTGLLASPLFSFTPDELYEIRRGGTGETLYEALVSYTNVNPEFTKGVSFLKTLEYYRTIAEGIGVDALLFKLYRECGLLALASKNGGKENLTLLYDYARKYEGGAFRGLYNFISFINSLIDKRTTFDDPRELGDIDAVNIVTCHASKGLEYPVVFLVEASGRISNKEVSNRLVFAEDFGIAFRLRTPSGLATVNNPVRNIINDYIYKKLYEEELRLLYVALTRARERLYIVGTSPLSDREKYERKILGLRENLTSYSLEGLSSFMEIALVAGDGCYAMETDDFIEDTDDSLTTESESAAEAAVVSDTELIEKLTERFTYEYPHTHLTRLPEKMSVSRMSPTVLDGNDGESNAPTEIRERRKRLPAFLAGGSADESAKRGIATHYFLQFCDLCRLYELGGEKELARLVDSKFISTDDAHRVRMDEIEMFRRSALFSEMLSAKKIHREFRFNTRLPADEFTTEDELKRAYQGEDILVQGVIDCIIERADGTLALYDYKTDRLTREELEDRTLAEEKLRSAHKNQLTLYALAAEKIFGRAPDMVAVYSLPLGDTVEI